MVSFSSWFELAAIAGASRNYQHMLAIFRNLHMLVIEVKRGLEKDGRGKTKVGGPGQLLQLHGLAQGNAPCFATL
jgi:hypothetical protein